MNLSIHADKTALGAAAADHVQRAAAAAIASRGRFAVALSGGSTPWPMLQAFAARAVDWSKVHVFQVDERAVPEDDQARNWRHITATLLDRASIPLANRHPLPVERYDGDAVYTATLHTLLGTEPEFDVVQLGLGDDGHTASLVPGDPALEITDRDVAWTANPYQGTRRLTLTFPCLARAREVVWLVAGTSKREMVARLRAADPTIPAGRVPQHAATLFADAPAAG